VGSVEEHEPVDGVRVGGRMEANEKTTDRMTNEHHGLAEARRLDQRAEIIGDIPAGARGRSGVAGAGQDVRTVAAADARESRTAATGQHLPSAMTRTTAGTADRHPTPDPVAPEATWAAPRGLPPPAHQQRSPRAQRPGRVVGIDGIVFQCDADHPISALFIRPIQELSLRFRGRSRRARNWGVPLANHAGIRVRIAGADGRAHPYVVEQLNGTLVQNVANALSWTPWRDFKTREGRGGWDVTVPATAFEGVEPADVLAAIGALNREPGRPFYREICTAFIERIFGGRHLFDDVEVLDWLVPGPGPRIPEPAAPRFKPHARLSRRARYLLRVDELPALHVAVDAARAPDPARPGVTGDEALQRLTDRKRAPARVLFWFLAQVSRAWTVRLQR
jgi:hypothetical protein